MRKVLTFIVLMTGLACSTDAQQSASQPQQPGAAPQGSQDVVARIGGRSITVRELDEQWRSSNPAQHAQATQALYDGRRAALDTIIASAVIEEAAKAKGQSADEYTKAQIASRVKPVSDTDIAVFYGENRAQMQGRSLEQMSALIRGFLEDRERETARTALIAELRKGRRDIAVTFEPPRQQVAIAADDPALGPANAPITLVEFSDFQCPFCQRVAPTLKEIKKKYGDRVRIVWKDFPLTQIHPEAFVAAQAGLCAQEQGKFWEYHDRLFQNQSALQPPALKNHAAAIGLDTTKFSACLDSGKYQSKVQASMDAGAKLGVGSTPTTFINGRVISGAQPIDTFVSVIDDELQRRP